MSYVVSARKYRPARFDEVIGQQHVSQTLKKALQTDHLAHAFLFCGPRGVGKTTCARILAKVLNCQQVTDDFEPCGTCDNCRAFSENASFNIMELDAASNNSVEHIRTLVEQVRFQPQHGKYKIFIIDEVHMLSQSAFNAFLKTLEEPPPYAIFILATTEKHKIIPTILSRCQIFDFKRIQIKDTVEHLNAICRKEGIEAEPEALHIIAGKADGALRDALSIFDRIASFAGKKITYNDVIENLNVLDYDYYFRFTDALLSEDLRQVMLIFDEVLNNGFEGDLFITGLSEHLRNLLICKDSETLKLLEVSDSLKERYHQQASLAPASFILTALNICNECDVNYKMARNKRLHVEMALIKMCFIGRAVDMATTPPAVVAEKKTVDRNAPVKQNTQKEHIQEKKPMKEESPGLSSETQETLPPVKDIQETAEPEEPEPRQPKLKPGLRKSKSAGLPTLQSLDTLHAEVVEAESNGKHRKAAKLTQDDLENAWSAYIKNTDKDSVKTMLKGAEITIEGEEVTAVVGSALAESTIRQETELMTFLREQMHAPMLALKIQLDPSRSNAVVAKPKKLTDSEKYWRMKSVNPLVDEVRQRFDLKLENE